MTVHRLMRQSVFSMASPVRGVPRLSAPVLTYRASDHVAPARNAQTLYGLLHPHRRQIIYPRSWHILPLDVEHEQVRRDVVAFVEDPIGFVDGTEESS